MINSIIDFFTSGALLFGVSFVIILVLGVMIAMAFRKVVPTNIVHIVQTADETTAFGKGKSAGNSYYHWPAWVPKIGTSVISFPESIFKVSLGGYEAYDVARLPFVVDVTAFFRIDQADKAANRLDSFDTLRLQLAEVLQGAVRRILATNELENIMQDRAGLGKQFTDEVDEQIKEWGVCSVKTIEFMDIRDSSGNRVIENIMAKEKSRIEKESRQTVAKNKQLAEQAEITAQQTVDIERQTAEEEVGLRTATKNQKVGIAKEQADQEVQGEAKVTAERTMEVIRVNQEKEADIRKSVAIVNAEADKERITITAEADVIKAEADKKRVDHDSEAELTKVTREAEGKLAVGKAEAEAETLKLQAPVTAQITLAQKIGENTGYQSHLQAIEKIGADKEIGISMADAIREADLKIISSGSSDGNIQGGVNKLTDIFTPQGGINMTGALAGLAASEEGMAFLKKFNMAPSTE